MAIAIKAFANADDVIVAWRPTLWDAAWIGFELERRENPSGQVTIVPNRIPPTADGHAVQPTGIGSDRSPIRRCIWTDHAVTATGKVSYRVTAMKAAAAGFDPDPRGRSDWTAPVVVSGDAGDGLAAFFNRGTLMSQVVSRFVEGKIDSRTLHAFVDKLATPGFPARKYLSGDALHEILEFLATADRRGSAIFAAIYEINDPELVEALKPFGSRGHILIGNGEATDPDVAGELGTAGFEVKHRDLSRAGRSSPSVHNKFVVEAEADGGGAIRVLTGSTNWTTTGLCTQLNNALVLDRPRIAARYLEQWHALVAAGDALPAALKRANSVPSKDGSVELFFAATEDQAEFAPVLEAIREARHGILFAMFMPGQSPLLTALLDRAEEDRIFVHGVVSSETSKGRDGASVSFGGQVIKSGTPPRSYHRDVLLPQGISAHDKPSWAQAEFSVGEIHAAHMMAIVHTKAIVVDPFSDDCMVVTGSHNFSPAASARNDENLVIIRGNKALAQAYALHLNGVYDHYSWRLFLAEGGDPTLIYKDSLDGWKTGARARELAFWMS